MFVAFSNLLLCHVAGFSFLRLLLLCVGFDTIAILLVVFKTQVWGNISVHYIFIVLEFEILRHFKQQTSRLLLYIMATW
jgi:hypothetical protein